MKPKLNSEGKQATPAILEVNGEFYKRIDGLADAKLLPAEERKKRMREYMRVYRSKRKPPKKQPSKK